MQKNTCGARKRHASFDGFRWIPAWKKFYSRAVSRPAWTSSLKALFAATLTAGEILHLLFVQLDLARLLHLLTQIDQKHPEQFLLLGAQQRVSDLVFLRGKVLVGRLLPFEHRQHHAV